MGTKKKYTNKELAEAHVFPSELSPVERRKENNKFSKLRIQQIKNMTEEERLYSRIMQLKYIMEDYVKSENYDNIHTFSYFLNRYLNVLNINKTIFSKEISLQNSQLSRLLHNPDPQLNDKIAVRLEIHSNNIIPAIFWYRIYEKQNEWQLINDRKIRLEESKNVKNAFSDLNSRQKV